MKKTDDTTKVFKKNLANKDAQTVAQSVNKTSASTSLAPSNLFEESMQEISLIRDSLLSQKSEILNRDTEFKLAQLDIAKLSDEGDLTAQEQQNNISIQLHERERKSLLLIDRTLSKIAAGTFGECESCGDEISIKRLQARPLTPFCINCMEEQEEKSSSSIQIQ